jgi:hypothetical protein
MSQAAEPVAYHPGVYQSFVNWWQGPPQQDGYSQTVDELAQVEPGPRTIHQCVERFTHNLKLLTVDLHKRCPEDATVYRAKQRIMAGITADPLNVVNIVGPYLLRYQKEIDEFGPEVETFFMANSFDQELKESMRDEAAAEKVDLARYIIPKVKEIARDMEFEQKKQRIDLVSEMLSDYLDVAIMLQEQ